jgi:hypothetical protein
MEGAPEGSGEKYSNEMSEDMEVDESEKMERSENESMEETRNSDSEDEKVEESGKEEMEGTETANVVSSADAQVTDEIAGVPARKDGPVQRGGPAQRGGSAQRDGPSQRGGPAQRGGSTQRGGSAQRGGPSRRGGPSQRSDHSQSGGSAQRSSRVQGGGQGQGDPEGQRSTSKLSPHQTDKIAAAKAKAQIQANRNKILADPFLARIFQLDHTHCTVAEKRARFAAPYDPYWFYKCAVCGRGYTRPKTVHQHYERMHRNIVGTWKSHPTCAFNFKPKDFGDNVKRG